jgi:hypothetical protein
MLVCHLHVFYGGGEQFGHSQRGIIGMSAKECIDALYQPRGIGFARQTFLVSKPRRALHDPRRGFRAAGDVFVNLSARLADLSGDM